MEEGVDVGSARALGHHGVQSPDATRRSGWRATPGGARGEAGNRYRAGSSASQELTAHSMLDLIHNLPLHIAGKTPHQGALAHPRARPDYGTLSSQVLDCASGLLRLGLGRSERVAVYLEKLPETVIALFGAAAAGGVFGPVNPLLKPDQVAYILRDCNVRILVTSVERLGRLASALNEFHELPAVI